MLKQVLILLIGAFFVLSGLNHFFNNHVITGYAKRMRLPSAELLVKLSGILLIAGGVAFVFPDLRLYAVIALAGFVALAAVLIHHFWDEKGETRMYEALQFAKNALIFVELLYIQFA